MPDLQCRVAKLEEQILNQKEGLVERRRQGDLVLDEIKEIREEMQQHVLALKQDISEIKGFANGMKAGALLVASIIGSAITILIDRIINH